MDSPATFQTRLLSENDAVYLRMIRLEALTFYGPDFAEMYKREFGQPMDYWRGLAKGSNLGHFIGLYKNNEVIGIQCTRIWEDDPTNKTAFWWGNFILEQYRGRGIMKMLYNHRIKWAEDHGCTQAVAYVHGANKARPVSILKKLGGQFMYTKNVQHGSCAPIPCDWYKIPIPPVLSI